MSASYFPPIISSIYLEELAGQATDAKDSALVALNAAEAARDTALEYRNDAQTYYTQVQQIQEGDYVTNLSLEERLSVINFADLQGIPATFAPSAHGHSWSEIANKPTMYPPTAHGHAWNEITGKPTEFEPLPHVHTWQQIAQKPGTFPPETHFHSWSEIENKPSVFNPAAHTHSWGDISGKPTKFEPAAHTHTWDLIENKPLTFPPQSHHHHWSQVTSKPEQATRWPHFSEVTNKPVQATRWPTFSEVTDKPDFGTASLRSVGVLAGNIMEVEGNSGLGGLGYGGRAPSRDFDASPLGEGEKSGFYYRTNGLFNVNMPCIVVEGARSFSVGARLGELYFVTQGDGGVTDGKIQRAYHDKNVVGVVSQLSGTVTGAIIERGSNANGEYVKFADGTMMCTHTLSTSAGGEVVWVYPAVFKKIAALNAMPLNTHNFSQSPRFRGVDSASAELSIFKSDNTRIAAPIVQLLAVGRWY